MQRGLSLQEMANVVSNQARDKKDYLSPSSLMHMDLDADRTPRLRLGGDKYFQLGRTAETQVREYTKIPSVYWKRCLEEAPPLLSLNVNHWLLQKEGETRMVRTLGDRARAVLSPGYRALDNNELVGSIIPILAEEGVEIHASNVSEDYFHLQGFVPTLRQDVRVGDTVELGISVRNSEVGKGRLTITRWLKRLICLNGMKGQEILGKTHLGKQMDQVNVAQEYLRDSTRELNDQAFFETVKDAVRGNLTELALTEECDVLRKAAGETITIRAGLAVEVVRQHCNLSERQGQDVLDTLIRHGDMSRWGYANAVTAQAHDESLTFDQNMDFQVAGRMVMELPQSKWAKLAEAV